MLCVIKHMDWIHAGQMWGSSTCIGCGVMFAVNLGQGLTKYEEGGVRALEGQGRVKGITKKGRCVIFV